MSWCRRGSSSRVHVYIIIASTNTYMWSVMAFDEFWATSIDHVVAERCKTTCTVNGKDVAYMISGVGTGNKPLALGQSCRYAIRSIIIIIIIICKTNAKAILITSSLPLLLLPSLSNVRQNSIKGFRAINNVHTLRPFIVRRHRPRTNRRMVTTCVSACRGRVGRRHWSVRSHADRERKRLQPYTET